MINLPELRDLAFVKRWAIVRTIRSQSVAEHSFFVAVYAAKLWEELEGGQAPPDIFMYALTHDYSEIHSGDIPSPYKKRFVNDPSSAVEVPAKIAHYVKLADLIEAMLFLIEEEKFGNQLVRPIINELDGILKTVIDENRQPEKAKKLIIESLLCHLAYEGRIK